MKDALRYVETGELGKLAIKPKPKEKGSIDEDLEEDNICVNEPVAVNGTTDEIERQTAEHVSNSSGITKEEEILTSASTREQTSLSKHTPDQCKAGEGAELSSLNLSEAKGSEQMEQKDSEEGVHASGNAVGVLSDKQFGDDRKDETEKTRQGKGKTKIKKDVSVPRRASKRLAGVALDPTPELKATRARGSSINQTSVPDGAENSSLGNCINRTSKQPDLPDSSLETSCALDASKSKEPIPETSNMLPSGDRLAVNGHVGNLETKTNVDEDKSVLPLGKLEGDGNASDVPGSNIDMPLADLWTDPCIAFAIQTLTGIPCDIPNISESNSGKVPGIPATPEAHSDREENGNKIVERQGCGINMPPTYPTIRKERVGSSLETPLADIWADPCIEFAIKTLTGAIPVEYGLDNQHGFQQQPISAPHQSVNHSTLPDVGMDKFSQANFIRQQYDVAGKSRTKEHGISRNPIYNYSHHRRNGEWP
ncbi:methyl-CpG-binding domain-containing protein 13-like isoform X2 [Hibiscus syriacus]|nr:methyl-CpG-binding domain-containing protein 13-like isoform X2 [Hibiscus syriacus]